MDVIGSTEIKLKIEVSEGMSKNRLRIFKTNPNNKDKMKEIEELHKLIKEKLSIEERGWMASTTTGTIISSLVK
ncbi:MAG: hypothetical protein QXX38_00510 [Candidatus Aenigmatarchaeota archaeon]